MEGGASNSIMPTYDKPLYHQIADWVRQEIIEGRLKPGARLPSIRQMTTRWNCTPGTVQRAYTELVNQGLVVSRPGQGTHVINKPRLNDQTSLRNAILFHRAEAFLLENLTSGYLPDEVEHALQLALDHWLAIKQQTPKKEEGIIHFAGSHDPALSWIAAHFSEITPGHKLKIVFNGSLGGLIDLAEGNADLVGSHLWDKETDTYNAPFVRRLLPGRRIALITFAHRWLGLIVAPGNPAHVIGLSDLPRSDLVFVNRQVGSGTRVWLDAALHTRGIDTLQIVGYKDEKMTHTDVALAIKEKKADVGFGLESAALTFGLPFIPLVNERYDLVVPEENLALQPFIQLVDWLSTAQARQTIQLIGGNDTTDTGVLTWVE
jgi:molybdate-binding protein/DNA-binding transcriptional regulator YhcF (GntR family)